MSDIHGRTATVLRTTISKWNVKTTFIESMKLLGKALLRKY